MKKNVVLFILVFIVSVAGFSQCNISVSYDDPTMNVYSAGIEEIYVDPDFVGGIKAAYLNTRILQQKQNPEMLIFEIIISTMIKDKAMVVPRKLQISFSDGTKLYLESDNMYDVKYYQGCETNKCSFFVSPEDFTSSLMKKAVVEVQVIDNRTGNKISCSPYNDLIKEQANCLAKRVLNK